MTERMLVCLMRNHMFYAVSMYEFFFHHMIKIQQFPPFFYLRPLAFFYLQTNHKIIDPRNNFFYGPPPPLPWPARALDVIYGHAQRAPAAEAFHPASTGGSPHARLIWSSSCASSAAGWEDCGAARGSRQQQGSSASSRPGRHGRDASMSRRACFRAVASVVHGHGRRGERGKWKVVR